MTRTVRDATMEDAGVLHALASDLADALGDSRPEEGAVRARLRELLEKTGARVLVVEDEDGEVLGAATLWIKPDLAHGDTVIEVPMLVVSKSARRGGIGKLLVEEVRKVAAEEGASMLELIATQDNDTARAFYKSLGFVETDHVALEYVGDMQEDLPDPEE